MFPIPFLLVSILLLVVVAYAVYRRLRFSSAVTFAFSNTLFCGNPENKNACTLHPTPGPNNNDPWKAPLALDTYSPETASYCLGLIRLVYDADTASQLKLPPGFMLVASLQNSLDKERSVGYVLQQDDVLWVVYRGTKHASDFAQDMNMTQSPFRKDGVMVHKGFLQIYVRIADFLAETLSRKKDSVKTILLTGHSLGGSLAMLSLYDAVALYSKTHRVVSYTFGCPRVGNQAFVDQLRSRPNICYRVANTSDVFPQVPLPITLNVVHPTHPFFYNHYGKLFSFTDNRLNYTLNHAIDTYLENIERIGRENVVQGILSRAEY